MLTIVCSRFAEDVNWLNDLSEKYQIIIYNKGMPLKDVNEKITVYNVQNIGREGESYLRFLSDKYNEVSDKVVFTQGDPFKHSFNFFQLLEEFENDTSNQIFPLTQFWNNSLPPKYLVNEDKYYLEEISRYTLAPMKFYDDGIKIYCMDYINAHKLKIGDDLIKHFCSLIDLPDDGSPHHFFYSGCFGVTKKAIQSYKKEFYANCHNLLFTKPAYGVIFERIWYKMFKKP